MAEARIIRTCKRLSLIVFALGAAAPAHADVQRSLSDYVKARAADADGASVAAAQAYAAALAGSPGNPVVAVRAYREALSAGDMALARQSTQVLEAAGLAPPDTVLIAAADAVARKDWGAVNAATDRMAGGPLEFMAPVIRAWCAFERGDRDAQQLLSPPVKNALARRFNAENRAYLLIAGGRVDAGVAELRSLLGAGAGTLDLRVNAARLLVDAGRRDVALGLLAGSDPLLTAMRARIAQAGVAPTAQFGVSRLFSRLAADLVRGEARTLSIALARSAMLVDPADDRTRLILADALSAEQAHDRAIALLDGVAPVSVFYASAMASKVALLTRAGEAKRALETARLVSAMPGGSVEDAQRYGDLLVSAGRFDDAASAYQKAMSRAGANPPWILYLQRGGALEQAGKWRAARPLLERAVQLAPEQAVALNYLGYAQIERGENVVAARALLERAVALQPEDSAIADSLGWAYVRGGMLNKALPLLERAARAQPGDVTIQEHLGDAYWQSGRRYEARYAWRAASVFAGGPDAARLTGKITTGLR